MRGGERKTGESQRELLVLGHFQFTLAQSTQHVKPPGFGGLHSELQSSSMANALRINTWRKVKKGELKREACTCTGGKPQLSPKELITTVDI